MAAPPLTMTDADGACRHTRPTSRHALQILAQSPFDQDFYISSLFNWFRFCDVRNLPLATVG